MPGSKPHPAPGPRRAAKPDATFEAKADAKLEVDIQRLRRHGIQPSAQRVAVASYVLTTEDHPSADQVWRAVRRRFPMLSRATVYNTLNLFVAKGLLRELALAEGRVVFDPKIDKHHHFIDDETGAIFDVPWEALTVGKIDALKGYGVREYSVVLRGTKLGAKRVP